MNTKLNNSLFYLLLSLVLVYFVKKIIFYWDLTIDDAYISARYAQNLAEHFSLSWNPGLPATEGYTNFLLVVLTAFAGFIGIPIVTASKLIGIFSAISIILYLTYLGYKLAHSKWTGLLAATVFSLHETTYIHAVGGLETTLYALLLLMLAHVTISIITSQSILKKHLILLSIIGLAAGMTRPEGSVVAGFVLLTVVSTKWKVLNRSHYITLIMTFLVPGVIYMIWRYTYFGFLFPNTFYHKVDHIIVRANNKKYFKLFGSLLVTMPVFIVILLGFRWKKATIVPMVLMIAASAIYTISDTSNMGYGHRFLYPCWPLILFLFTLSLGNILVSRHKSHPFGIIEIIAISGLFILICYTIISNEHRYRYWRVYGYSLKRAHVIIGKLLNQVSPNGKVAVWSDAGAIPYYSKWTAMDIGGLLDSHIRHNGFTPKYLFDFHPDAVVMTANSSDCTDPRGIRKSSIFKDNSHDDYVHMGSFVFTKDRYYQIVYGRKNAFNKSLHKTIERSPYNVNYEKIGNLYRNKAQVLTDDNSIAIPKLEIRFADRNPQPHSKAGLKRVYRTEKDKEYILTCMIHESYKKDSFPGIVRQRIYADGVLIDDHDISYPAFSGWRKVEKTFKAKGNTTAIEILLETGKKVQKWSWGTISTTQIQGLTIEEI